MPNTYKPAAVRLLATVIDRHCATHHIFSDDDRMTIADVALSLYNRGIEDEEVLLAALSAHSGTQEDPV